MLFSKKFKLCDIRSGIQVVSVLEDVGVTTPTEIVLEDVGITTPIEIVLEDVGVTTPTEIVLISFLPSTL